MCIQAYHSAGDIRARIKHRRIQAHDNLWAHVILNTHCQQAHVAGSRNDALGDLKLLLVHGSPRRVNEYLYADRPVEGIERLLDQAAVDVLVCGHTHLPYHRVLPSGRHLINAGSVGKPKDGDPRAGYVVLSANGRELSVEFIRVDYDHEAAARAVEATDLPGEFAQMLRAGVG